MDDTATMETAGTGIAVIEQTELERAYSADEARKTILDALARKARAEAKGLTVETEAGRKAIASLAYKLARSKTAWDEYGKALGADLREKLNALNAVRKSGVDVIEGLQREVRGPLTEYEEAEKRRLAALRARLSEIDRLAHVPFTASSEDLRGRLEEIDAIEIGEDWQDMAEEATTSLTTARMRVSEALEAAKAREEQEARLRRLREVDAIAHVPPDAAPEAVEAKLEELEAIEVSESFAELDDAIRRARNHLEVSLKAAQQRAEQAEQAARMQEQIERLEAEKRAREEEENARKVEADRQEREKRLAEERLQREAERQAELERREKAAQEAAAEAERARIAEEKEKEEAEAKRRAENARIRKRVLKEIAADLGAVPLPAGITWVGDDLPNEALIALAEALAEGRVRHVTVTF